MWGGANLLQAGMPWCGRQRLISSDGRDQPADSRVYKSSEFNRLHDHYGYPRGLDLGDGANGIVAGKCIAESLSGYHESLSRHHAVIVGGAQENTVATCIGLRKLG